MMGDWTLGIAMFVGGLSWAIVFWIRRWAEHLCILDLPNHRSSHSRPVPRGGGTAISAICLIGAALLWRLGAADAQQAIAAFFLGGLLVTIISGIDDVRHLSTVVRFLAHSAAAVALLIGCGFPQEIALPLLGPTSLTWLGVPALFLWIVGLTNAYNFMDGIDGIAAVQAIAAGIGWFLLGRFADQQSVATLGLLAAAGSAGFLIHNWSPAKIFMGDVGSAFLGFLFAALAVMAGRETPRLYVAGVLLVWPFVFDAVFTFLRRAWRRENLLAAHRSHLYQRLVLAGWSHAQTTSLYAVLDLLGLALALLCTAIPGPGDWASLVMLPLLMLGLWLLVVAQERRNRAGQESSL